MDSPQTRLFTRKALLQLMIPLIIEQTLEIMIGMADTLMVAGIGEVAMSGVALVDQINNLLIRLFSAMATGGVIVTSQYLGRKDLPNARNTARLLTCITVSIALALMTVAVCFNRSLLRLSFGSVEEDVLQAAVIYFYITALSYPFLAMYNVGGALFRAMGNSKVSMYVSFGSNLFNVVGNAFFIYVCKWGVFGAGVSTFLSRVLSAGVMLVLLQNKTRPVHLRGIRETRFAKKDIWQLLRMSIPNGVENGMFQVGKLLMVSIISTLGTSAIAAHSVCNSITNFVELPASALGVGALTVIGQCVGARDYDGARYYGKRLLLTAFIGVWTTCLITFLLRMPFISLYHMPESVNVLAKSALTLYLAFAIFIWPCSFTLPNILRGAGDARYTMLVSMLTMFLCRLVLCYVFTAYFHWGLNGIWGGMIVDWFVRSAFFLLRFFGKKWLQIKVID